MRYIYAVPGSAIALVIFSVAVLFSPIYEPSDDIQIILTISTFLFAILVGFFIARLNTRYNLIKEYIADEDSLWLIIYKTAGIISKELQGTIREIIDKYYIISYDHGVGNWYKYNAGAFLSVFDELGEAIYEVKDEATLIAETVVFLKDVEQLRNKTSVVALDKLTKGHWGVLIGLAVIIVFCLFYLMVPDLYSQVITVALSTILVLVLLIMRDLQNLRIGGKDMLDESGEELLECIGKKRYYNEKWIKNGSTIIPPYVEEYRVGLHAPGEEPRIEIRRNR